jgi:hypothetical protein
MRFLIKGNRNTKRLSYTTLVLPIPEYRAAYWNPCGDIEINALYRVQTIAAQCTHHTMYYYWENLARADAIP